jgi:hypothetical protein
MGPGTKCSRSAWYDFMQPNYSIISSRSQEVHDQRRRVWSPALSTEGWNAAADIDVHLANDPQALRQYESRIIEYVQKLERHIDSAASSAQPVDVKHLCYWFAFDIMGEFAFGQSFSMLDNKRYHDIIEKLRRALELLGPFSSVLWLARIAFAFFPGIWRVKDWHDMMAYCRRQMGKRIEVSFFILHRHRPSLTQGVQRNVEKPDISSHLIAHAKKNGLTDIDRKFLNGDAVTVIIGGRLTTPYTSLCPAR